MTPPTAWAGAVRALFVAARGGAPMEAVGEVWVAVGTGIAGDRYESQSGRTIPPDASRGDVTLVEEEAIEAVRRDFGLDVGPGDTRRNVVTTGVPLNHLVGVEFRVGDAVLRGVELVEPCSYLARLAGLPALRKALVHRGGLRADVVVGGRFAVGDAVRPADGPEELA